MTILTVAALAVLLVLAGSQIFVIRDVMVVGNRNLLREEVVTQSGVKVGDNLLSITAQHLREKLEIPPAEPRYIKVVWGQGYKFES